MKKIDKYQNGSRPASLAEELQQYKKMSASLRKNASRTKSKKLSQLALVIPFAAASLSPFAIQAQCNAIVTQSGAMGEDWDVDIDANGSVDFTLNANVTGTPDLFINLAAANVEFAGSVPAGYTYVSRFTTGSITSGENWIGGGGVAGTLDFNNSAGPEWSGAGVVSGFIALRVDGNRLGFIEVTYDNATGDVTVGDAGVQDLAQAPNMSIPVGNCMVLPVELMEFSAKLEKEKVVLNWVTSSETDNRGFDIERSTDGVNYQSISFVQGQGNAIDNIDYSFTDENIKSNRQYYYRLKQIDYWGGSAYSEVITVQTERNLRLNIGANPTKADQLTVNFSADGNDTWELSIFDMQGRLRGEVVQISGRENQFDMDIQNLAAGTYFLKLTGNAYSEYKKFIKQD